MAIGSDSAPLEPELAQYLDWPLYFPDESVSCNAGHGCADDGPQFIASARRMTVRELLADIREHATPAQ